MTNTLANALARATPDIEHYNLRLDRFSLFRILRVEDAEIRHSNVLAWLFNPTENHGLNDLFFKEFVREVLLDGENDGKFHMENFYHRIACGDFSDLKVDREHDHIDVLCVSEDERFVLLIENKFHTGEHGMQLEKYLVRVQSQYPNHLVLPVFLSLEGAAPSHKSYCVASYNIVERVVIRILDLQAEQMRQDVKAFLRQYSQLIQEKTMSDDKLNEIARRIYRDNKEAIEYIHGIGNNLDIGQAVEDFTGRVPDLVVSTSKPNVGAFISKEMDVKNRMSTGWAKGNPVQYWFAMYNEQLKLCLEVGPFDNGKTRYEFLLVLQNNGVKIRSAVINETGSYTRIWNTMKPVKDWQDKDELIGRMVDLWNNHERSAIHAKVVKSIGEFSSFWQ
jgi:hypothetical protein